MAVLPLQAAYYGIFMFLTFCGIVVFLRTRLIFSTNRVHNKKGRYVQLQEIVQDRLKDDMLSKTLASSGVPLTAIQYQLLRYVLLLIILISSVISKTTKGGDMTSSFIMVVGLYFISSPVLNIFKQKTIFKYVMDFLQERYKYKKNLEIYRAISQLKNLIIVKQKNPPGSIYILEQLNKFTKITKPIFNRMLSLWTLGRKEEACKYFIETMNTDQAEEIANLLVKLDKLNPFELKNQLLLFQEDFKQKRQTEKLKQNQYRSHMVYGFVIISLIMVMLNFIIVGFLMDLSNSFQFINQ